MGENLFKPGFAVPTSREARLIMSPPSLNIQRLVGQI